MAKYSKLDMRIHINDRGIVIPVNAESNNRGGKLGELHIGMTELEWHDSKNRGEVTTITYHELIAFFKRKSDGSE